MCGPWLLYEDLCDKNSVGGFMNKKFLSVGLAFMLVAGCFTAAYGLSSFRTAFRTAYGTGIIIDVCDLCHPGGDTGQLNNYANDFLNAGANAAAFRAIENMDSDGDGFTNIAEITARTFPGDATSRPSAADTTAPVVGSFVMPTTSTSLTVVVSSFTATDAVGVTGYLITETSATPTASAAGWTATAPTSYTFSTAGTKSAYAWAKDAAGNVSAPMTDTLTITLPDTAAPAISAFAMPSTSTTLAVPVTNFSATDNVSVTGYLITETSTAPTASATGWTATAPTSYTFSTAGSKTAYGWAKDAAGNISAPVSDTLTITLPDATAPVVSAFVIPASATSLTVAITTFTATDNVAVTGYMVTETSATPSASATGWSATRPASYAFATAGSHTLYAWTKDAAGNISSPMTAATTITLPDATAPVINGFSVPASATSLTVAISVLTATDNMAVTGYMVTETSTIPSASAAGWMATAPTSYTFSSAGSRTLYGWAKDAAGNVSVPVSAPVTITLPDATAPAVTAFAIASSSTSLTVAVTNFTATDNVAVTGYMVTETSTKPAASATGWTATAPTSFSFSSAGVKTAYGWAKDAAGNVSASANAATTITLPDATAPVVTGLAIPSTATSLTVAVTNFTATDNVAVTGYMVTETSTKPAASATGWTATAPTSYTFSSAGSKTLYGWAKDAAGNVSASLSATAVITMADATPPMVTAFVIPSTSAALTIPVTSFTATDNTAVTGFMVTETSTKPAASATGWTATAPTSYTFSSAGSKTLYGWTKDAAGNVSASLSATVTITAATSDTTAPVILSFRMPSRSYSRTVAINTLTATDNVKVTGYLITQSSTKPSASAAGWSSTAPRSFTFSSSGTRTAYAWAKDAAGNISASSRRTVAIGRSESDDDSRERDDD
jgi:hypothetical protein